MRANYYRFRPCFELLEHRLLPSCVIRQIDSDGNGSRDTLSIVGDSNRQVLDISARSSSTIISLDCNGDGDFRDSGELNEKSFPAFRNFDIRLAGGNDVLEFTPSGTFDHRTLNLVVDLGSGDDRFTMPDGGQPFDASKLNVEVQAGDGDDTLFTDDAPFLKNGSSYSVKLLLGDGDNVTNLNFDTDITENSTWNVAVQGSDRSGDVDKVYARWAGNVYHDARVTLDAMLRNGNDRFTGDVRTYFNLFGGEVQINVDGGSGNDSLTLTGNDAANGAGMDIHGLFDVRLNGASGADTIRVDFSKGDGLELDGNFLLLVDGGLGADAIHTLFKNTGTSRGNYDIAVRGWEENDTLAMTLTDSSAARVTYRNSTTSDPTDAFILLDGGAGTGDRCTTSITAGVPVQRINCEV